ncbi:SDR family oxidoreductase [Sinorhizobium meliloti]|uniref:Dehydrogenase n=1 Tax=Sinorhizobium meliloti (strain SM11) TaxID=707241 RepID=F7XD15_SINMM|nr:SDR family oxidoreductase [Sinorhizobium meliloti]PST22637.1 3-oxoacyl-ACP reductase [Mesorhizobium loti]AEH81494.1 dehydrogenase [Sinorhizobium meliloti SM11]ARS67584.1 3-oxoacyl-ACP reductase [Sinorhizobium meliloti RU11/001]ASP66654.1 3-oxoacyl-ACP reductase [Sinorhizobium meliloti]MBP2470898.1 NAD(P)-dependent dehydrogenase (short-subunit alcohol dehydrogenase family) [Sinorhizobium meliloti]
MTDKVCLITGGGRGMGAAVAREMHARGYKLVLMSPSENCETLAAELGGIARRGVAQSAADLKGIADLAMSTYGRIDAVLNHTGHPPKGDLLEITDENWDLANDMIAKSVIRMARLVTPVMEAQGGGSIVNITTYAAFEPSLWFPASCVYRAGVSSFTKLYSDRYGPKNIRMNCLLPGFTDSLDVGKFADLTALKRIGRVEEQAKAAAFLLSDDSSYITGQSLRVDGGLTRHM